MDPDGTVNTSRLDMADDNMIHETIQPAENGVERERPDDTEEDNDMADDGKKCINDTVDMNKFSIYYRSAAYIKTLTI